MYASVSDMDPPRRMERRADCEATVISAEGVVPARPSCHVVPSSNSTRRDPERIWRSSQRTAVFVITL